MLICSCNDEVVNLGEMKTDFADQVFYNADISQKDSGKIILNLKSPLIKQYSLIDSPFMEFPKGLNLNFFSKKSENPGFLKADWAKTNDKKGIYEGKGNVVIINDKGDTLKTQHIFWNRLSGKVHTQDTVFIISSEGDSLQANNGLEASDDLKQYTLYNNRGVKFFEDNEGKF